ncbi:DNA-protecting protein DprA [Ectothiorhodospiraceae bacterium WFHF3C12]|nr:DNA-protecting protein DprA [Ectothiorhodospiraceae bacterium WFHF3C12]
MSDPLGPWLALWRVPGIGPAVFARALERFGNPEAALRAGTAAWRELDVSDSVIAGLREPDWAGAEADLHWAEQAGHNIVRLGDTAYPPLLADTAAAPPLLFVVGDLELLRHPQLAVVGSRNPTAGGRDNAREFTRYLAGRGLGITSGLALGIDSTAHEGALDADGITLAVMGTGPDRIYPARNRELAHRIAGSGALITEFPTGVTAQPANFPRRNRIISGLSVGTLVVEAGLRSGSLLTARAALDQGREVFAIPGSIHNPLARGCHALIRQGAKLVEQAQDIIEELPPLGTSPESPREPAPRESQAARGNTLDDEQQRVLEALGYDPTPVDVVVERSGLTAEIVSSILLVLELEGHVTACPGGRYVRAG